MSVEISPELEQRLRQAAVQRSQTVPEFVEDVLTEFLNSCTDDASTTVQAVRPLLPGAWPVEDFSDWRPPDGR